MANNNDTVISPVRLRLGVAMILLWWIPFWMLAPVIASWFDSTDTDHLTAIITTIIMVIQTVIGIAGMYLAGSQVADIVKGTSKRKAIGIVWYMLVHGKLQDQKAEN